MMNKIYTAIIYGGLTVSMVFSPLARGATTTRPWAITVFMVLILTVVFAGLLKMLNKEQTTKPKLSRPWANLHYTISHWENLYSVRSLGIALTVFALIILAIISFVFSVYKHDSFFALLRLLAYVGLIFILAANYSKKLMIYFISLTVCIAAILSIYGLLQYFSILPHSWWEPAEFLSASYVNHNHFAGYLEMAIPLLIGLALGIFGSQSFSRLKKGLLSFMILLALATTLTAFVFAQSRGAWVSLGLALLLMNIILVRRKVLRSYSLIIFLFIMAGAFSYLYHSDSKVSERLGTMVDLSQAEASMTTRMDIWRGTLAMIKDKPLTGVGIGCFEWAFPKYRSETLGRAGIRPVYAHNDYLHMTAELGVFALPLIFWILLSLISRGISTIKLKDARGIKATFLLLSCGIGILSLSLHAFVDFNFHIPANMLTFVVLSGIILGASVSERK